MGATAANVWRIPAPQKSLTLKHQTHSADNLHTFASRRGKTFGTGAREPRQKAGARSVTCMR